MRVNIDIDDETRDAVKAYADKEGFQMSRAYAELIEQMLTMSVRAIPRGDGLAIQIETDSWGVFVPIDSKADEPRLVNAEYAPAWGEWQDD